MATLRQILAQKGPRVFSIAPGSTVLEAAQLMNGHRIGSLAVVENGQLVGIFTERDILMRIVARQLDPTATKVHEVMTREVVCGGPHTTVEEARGVMKNRRLRHLPILDEVGQLCGMVSIGDLNAYETHDKEMTIHLLQEYISGPT